MLSFLRRKKPTGPERRLSTEELAAAFPTADGRLPEVAEPRAGVDQSPAAAAADAQDALPEAVMADRRAAETEHAGSRVDAPAEVQVADDAQPRIPFGAAVAPAAIAGPPSARTEPAGLSLEAVDEAQVSDEALPPALAQADRAPAHAPVDASGIPDDAAAMPPAAAGKSGWRERLRGTAFTRSFAGLFSRNPKLDEDLLDEIETALLTADVGVTATTELVGSLRRRMKAREFADANAMLAALRTDLLAMLAPVARPLVIDAAARPFVLLTVGVNGVGKTTTIGKLARRFKDENRSLMLAAGDTFRAAAVAQLQAWGDRNGVPVVAQGQNADPASVAFDALQAAKARGTGVLIADTAGRLHTQQGLMAELGKIRRVLQKIDPAAPHEVLLVIDGTTGQNALSQLRQFHAAVGVTGLVVTKLDGTAKGGVLFALAREFGIPIRFVGIGERPEDLRVFDPVAFVDALLPEALGRG
jgi:fused signal recognition particle receptor